MNPGIIVAGTIVAALSAYMVISHTATWMEMDGPRFQQTRTGFGVALLADLATYGAVLGLGVWSLGFEGLPFYWPAAAVGFAMHLAYTALFFPAHALYRRIHRYEYKRIFSDGQFVLGKKIMLGVDTLCHAASVGIVVLAVPEEALTVGLLGGGVGFSLLWLRRTPEQVPAT